MPESALSVFVAQTARAVAHPTETDGQLLSRYITVRDEAAFAELVNRHGPFVLAVCRRTTGDRHLAEDAFQAAFVVLARRANDVRPREGVRPFLYGVAVRVAREARAVSARRNARELAVPSVPDRPAEPLDLPDVDALRVLDEEVAALPDHLRAAVVLCELDGLSRKEAATQLGIAEGTLSSRLAKARKLLSERLRKRGMTLPAAGLGVLGCSVPVSARLFSATAAFATPGTIVSNEVGRLSAGVIRKMFVQKLRVTLSLTALLLGTVVCTELAATAIPVPPAELPTLTVAPTHIMLLRDPPVRKENALTQFKSPNKLFINRGDKLTIIDPDGKNERDLEIGPASRNPMAGCVRLSPDGSTIAIVQTTEGLAAKRTIEPLRIRKADEEEPGTDLGVQCQWFVFSPDGAEIACNEVNGENRSIEVEHFIVNVKTKAKTALKLPKDHLITDWSRDGKYFLTTAFKGTQGQPDRQARLYLMNRDGTEAKALTTEKQVAAFGRLSPDGTKVLFSLVPDTSEAEKKKEQKGNRQREPKQEIIVMTIATGKMVRLQEMSRIMDVHSFCWSPDGKRVAYTNYVVPEGKPGEEIKLEIETQIIVCDADGKNRTTIASEISKSVEKALSVVDWR
ncbi:MAG TPA: sigma-70 family RNA polymerase sigma factor [Gemmata sp.]|jgi:RNA polymerase sigma factor (sigma-70 family)|nr:sigma-70 family RNA polymerase sigma factor [Gemmata sp.]